MQQRKLESDADCCCGRDRCHSGGFLLRIMPPSWHPVPACTPRLCCMRAIHRCSNDGAAAIPKFGPEIKNRCTQEGLNREILASILKSGLEIKNRCTQERVNGENLASIPKSGPEIKNRCSTRLKNRCSTMESALCRGRGMPDGQAESDAGALSLPAGKPGPGTLLRSATPGGWC